MRKIKLGGKNNKCELLINKWLKRNLTFFGKIKVLKTLVMPLFVYLVQSVKVPHDMIKTINTLIFKFLWLGKREKIKRSTLIGNKTEGGLDMLDTESFFRSLKIKWIKTLLNKEEANWKILPNYFLNIFGKDFLIFHMNLCHIKNIKNIGNLFIPDFYKDLIENWLHSKKNKNIESETFEKFV